MRFDAPPPSGGYSTFANTGKAPVSVAVVRRSGGTIGGEGGIGADGRSTGYAARFPRHATSSNAPAAVVRIRNAGSADGLDPGTGRFTVAADVKLDTLTSTPGSGDDGDNVVQRGLYSDVTQYKLQVDARRPMCRIKGRSGTVELRSSVVMQPWRWYRLTCVRDGGRVTLSVTSWSSDGTATTTSTARNGATGSMRPSSSGVPLSVGGKLSASGSILASADQLNGLVDNVRLHFG